MLLRSALLEAQASHVHAFTTRRGGVSEGALASLNLARRGGESDAKLAENWGRVLAAMGTPGASVAVATQVHGDAVLVGDAAADPRLPIGEADAIIVTRPGVLAAVRVADCVPILLAAPGGAAAVHAGWRGTALGIVERAVAALCAATGAAPGQVRAAIGPCIGVCCYSVGAEVADAVLERSGDDAVVRREAGALRVDLAAANRAMLRRAGVAQVDVIDACTRCRDDLFSHRGDGPDTGRQVGIVGLRP